MGLTPLTSPVLVTGVTGFIGREVARRFLAAGRPVLAMARGRDGESAADRVAGALGLVADGRRLDVIEADLTKPGCGLEKADWRRLRDTVESVIHCAGETSFFPQAMAPFRGGHIDGPLDLLRGLGSGRLRRWTHLSTAYVCGRRSGVVLEHEKNVGQRFHNPYERVKLESEATIRQGGDRMRVGVRVLRPSIVVGAAPETAGGHPSNLFSSFIRMVATLGKLSNGSEVPLRILAAPRARFNIVPVDYVAAATVALAEHPGGQGETFHIVVSDAPTQEQMLAMVAERLSVRGLSLVDPRLGEFPNPSPLERMVARRISGYREYLEQDVRFDDSTARRLLDRCGVPRPTLSRNAVHRLIDQALGSSTITIPPNGIDTPFALHPLTLS